MFSDDTTDGDEWGNEGTDGQGYEWTEFLTDDQETEAVAYGDQWDAWAAEQGNPEA